MLVEAIESCQREDLEMVYPGNYTLHKRMPEDVERSLMKAFEEYKKLYAKEV